MTYPQLLRREVTVHDRVVRLGRVPHAILTVLLMNRGHFVARPTIIDFAWPDPDNSPLMANHCIDIYMVKLRRLLGRDIIENRRGGWRGYGNDTGAFMMKRFIYER